MTEHEKHLIGRLAETEGLLCDFLERKEGDFVCPFCGNPVTYWPEGHSENCLVPRTIQYMEKYYGKRVR